jgi:hypothetical protein
MIDNEEQKEFEDKIKLLIYFVFYSICLIVALLGCVIGLML